MVRKLQCIEDAKKRGNLKAMHDKVVAMSRAFQEKLKACGRQEESREREW